MEIKVKLPEPNNTSGKDIKKFLRQMELSIHYLQKSVQRMEEEGELTDDAYIIFRFPSIENKMKTDGESLAKQAVFNEDALGYEFQDVELEIIY